MGSQSYNQLCVWQGVTLASTTPEQFEKAWKEMGFRVKFSEEVKRVCSNQSILLFWIHDEDVMRFAVLRLKMGIRWWEDVVKYNNQKDWFTAETLKKYPVRW